nr:hypothetical protein [Caulobacter flavus]
MSFQDRHPGRSVAKSRDPGSVASRRPPPETPALETVPGPLGPG